MASDTIDPAAPSELAVPSPAEMYERYYGPAIFTPCSVHLLERAAPVPGESVLDLACGTGQVARRVAPLVGEAGSVTAVDLNPEMVETGRALPEPEGAAVDWRVGDASALDLPERAFDLVTCQHGLQFFPDRSAALGHVRRVLKPGGRAVFAVWRGVDRHPLFAAMAEAEARHLAALGEDGGNLLAPFSLGDEGELAGLLEDAGLTDVEIEERSIEARFPGPGTWVRNMQVAYAAVVPALARDTEAFDAFVAAVEAETRTPVRSHTVGEHVVVPMHALIATARKHAGSSADRTPGRGP